MSLCSAVRVHRQCRYFGRVPAAKRQASGTKYLRSVFPEAVPDRSSRPHALRKSTSCIVAAYFMLRRGVLRIVNESRARS